MSQGLPPPTDMRFERVPGALNTEPYLLTLFVSGASEASARAIANVREICDSHVTGEYELGIVDLNQEAQSAGGVHVLATPSLVRDRPLPKRMLVGDMSDHSRVLLLLDMVAIGPASVGSAA
jgi:circadian clock protein KaiB